MQSIKNKIRRTFGEKRLRLTVVFLWLELDLLEIIIIIISSAYILMTITSRKMNHDFVLYAEIMSNKRPTIPLMNVYVPPPFN